MTWEIVAGLLTLCGTMVTLGTVLAKLVRALMRLELTISALETTLAELKSGNDAAHREIWNELEEHDERITKLEYAGVKK